jgi:hypothetical protein
MRLPWGRMPPALASGRRCTRIATSGTAGIRWCALRRRTVLPFSKGIAPMRNKGVFIVMAKVSAEQEDDFNRWYDEDHMPKALNRFPGVISGRRHKILDGGDGFNYLAFYEFESQAKLEEAMKSDALKGLIQEFDGAFGGVERKRLLGVEIRSYVTG